MMDTEMTDAELDAQREAILVELRAVAAGKAGEDHLALLSAVGAFAVELFAAMPDADEGYKRDCYASWAVTGDRELRKTFKTWKAALDPDIDRHKAALALTAVPAEAAAEIADRGIMGADFALAVLEESANLADDMRVAVNAKIIGLNALANVCPSALQAMVEYAAGQGMPCQFVIVRGDNHG